MNQDRYRSLELFRRNTISPEIITFDELYDRARFIVHQNETRQSNGTAKKYVVPNFYVMHQGKHVTEPSESLYKNITLNDIRLAASYYPILIDLAKHKHCLTYGELVEKAKEMYPDKKYVQNAIAVSAGRKLDVVRIFTSERDLPDVTSLIINKNGGECGTGFTDYFNPEKARSEVYSYDWSEVSSEFDLYIETVEKHAMPRKRIKRPEAIKIMSLYYKDKKESYPASIKDKREKIIVLLMNGFSTEESFKQVMSSN